MLDLTDLSDIDVDARKAERTYPAFGADDDDFHDEAMSDRWWETETQWFSWNVPERSMGGWTYCQARPNAQLCNGGAWVWDDTASYPWELPYHVNYSGLQLPPREDRDLRDFEWPNGVHVRTLDPLMSYAIAYSDPGGLEVDLRFDALIPPNPHPVGVVPFLKGTHFDQPGRVTGEVVVRGEAIAVDCFSVRDRSWGPRPAGRPKKRPVEQAEVRTGSGGIGYSFGSAGPSDAWLVYSVPLVGDDPISCGFLLRDGEYGHILGGRRRIEVDRTTGWPTRIEIAAVDDHGRRLEVAGAAVSRHWKGHGGDTLFRWAWDGLDGWGEDQSYFSRSLWEAYRSSGGTTGS